MLSRCLEQSTCDDDACGVLGIDKTGNSESMV